MLDNSGKTIIKMEIEKNSDEFKDDFIESILLNADHKILGRDFNDKTMKIIEKSYNYKKKVRRKLKLSAFYIFSGVTLIILYPLYNLIFQTTSNKSMLLSIIAIFILSVTSVIIGDNYKRFLKNYNF